MCKKCISRVVVRGLVLMLGLVLSAPAGAEELFFDDFAYSNGTNLNGIGGWTAADATGNSVLNDDGLGDGGTNSLQYPGATSLDGRLYVQAGSGTIHHALPRPVTGEGNFLYVSFLYKPLSIPGTYWFQLDTTGSIQGQLGRIDGRNTDGQVELGCRIRSTTALSKKPIPLGQTAFVVMKVTMVPGPSNDTVQLWVNPPVGVPEPPADTTSTETGNDINPETGIIGFSFRIGQSNSGTKEVDLIRVGTTWEDVTGHPYLNARGPSPRDGAEDIPRDAVLSWVPGPFAETHDVYFGTVFADVNTASRANPRGVLAGQGQIAATYDPPGRLDFGQTYYWRIDEVGAPPTSTISQGETWSFTVEPLAYPPEAGRITATASSSNSEGEGPENTINGSGLGSDDLHADENKAMWLSSITGAQPTWIQYDFDRVYKLHQMRVWNYNMTTEPVIGYGIKDAMIESSTDGVAWTPLGTTHEFARATGRADYAANTIIDLGGMAARYVRITANSNWGGILQQYGLSEVRFSYIPASAREPNPESGAADVSVEGILAWRPGREAARHDVYLSTDEQAVIDGSVPAAAVTDASYSPAALDLSSTYYWRIDEVNDAETPTIWQGDIWSFSTPEYLVVDDFEAYNDINPGQEGSNRIFEAWIDGFGIATNGALVGYDPPQPSMETVTVHGGRQSMPLFYSNTSGATYSEAARTLAAPQDWTKYGIQTLVLYFHGTPGSTGQLYVKVNGAKVSYPGDATDMTRLLWNQWNIDLASIGVNLQSVTTLAIGIDGNGAAGTLYFDDIGLYRLAPTLAEKIYLEAEVAAPLGASWRVYTDPASSGGSHIGSEDGDGNDNNAAPGAEWIATYNFTVSGGTYTVALRAQDAGDDSLWVRIPSATSQTHEDPDQPGTGWVLNDIGGPEGVWEWETVESDDHNDAVVTWTLPAGANTIEIAKREDGVWLDAIVISKTD